MGSLGNYANDKTFGESAEYECELKIDHKNLFEIKWNDDDDDDDDRSGEGGCKMRCICFV